MPHPLVEQLRFTRSEWQRGLRGVTGEILAIPQLLDHPRRPEFVGDVDGKAPYRSSGAR